MPSLRVALVLLAPRAAICPDSPGGCGGRPRPTKFWTSLCSTRRTAPDATARRQGGSGDRPWSIRFISPSPTTPRFAAVRRKRMPGTPMPAFAQSAGGMLTDEQIDAMVSGIRSRGRSSRRLEALLFRPMRRRPPVIRSAGAGVYTTYCSSCHGADGQRRRKASSIVDGSYLASGERSGFANECDSSAGLRLGAPDWRNDVPGKPMSRRKSPT